MPAGTFAKHAVRRATDPLAVWVSPGRNSPCQKSWVWPSKQSRGGVRGTPALLGIVADPRLLLGPVNNQHGRVHVEEQAGRPTRPESHAGEQTVVQPAEFREGGRRHTEQEAPERGGIRVAREAGEVLEHTVLAEQLGRLDPLEPEDDRVQQGQEHLAHTVPIVALRNPEICRHRPLEPDARQEPMYPVDAAVVRQVLRAEVHAQVSGAFGHLDEPYL